MLIKLEDIKSYDVSSYGQILDHSTEIFEKMSVNQDDELSVVKSILAKYCQEDDPIGVVATAEAAREVFNLDDATLTELLFSSSDSPYNLALENNIGDGWFTVALVGNAEIFLHLATPN